MIIDYYGHNERLTLIFIDLSFLNIDGWYGKRAPRVGVRRDRAITKFLFYTYLIPQNYGFPFPAPEWPLIGINGLFCVWF